MSRMNKAHIYGKIPTEKPWGKIGYSLYPSIVYTDFASRVFLCVCVCVLVCSCVVWCGVVWCGVGVVM